MNRSELVRAVAERAGSEEATARRHVDAVFEAVIASVAAGERVTVTGFGTFDSFSRPARSARNPRTGQPVEVPAAEVPRFRSGQTFRVRVAESGAEPEVEAAPVVEAAEQDAPVVVEVASPKKAKKAKKGADAKKAPKKGKAATSPGSGKKSGKAKAKSGK